MNRPLRYTLFALAFLFGLVGFVAGSPAMKIALIALAIPVGVLADVMENFNYKPFQQYNELHGHLKK